METPTIVKQTKDYLLIKVPLPKQEINGIGVSKKNSKMTTAEKCLLKALQESERDIQAGRVITAPNITEALHRYEKQQWD